MNFVSEFLEEVRKSRYRFSELLGDQGLDEFGSVLREGLDRHWHRLPEARDPHGSEYAVDSSSASRSLLNGLDYFIIQALMLGSDRTSFKKMRLEPLRGVPDPDSVNRFERVLRDLIEIEIVNEKCPASSGDIVLIDGNLYGRYTRIYRQMDIQGWEHLPLLLWEAMQKMFRVCEKRGIIVVGVSKFSKTRSLCNAFLYGQGFPLEGFSIPDVEMIYRWKHGQPGYTTPLILGDYGLRVESQKMFETPRRFLAQNFAGFYRRANRDLRDWGSQIVENVPDIPAIAMFHLVPAIGEHSLRIDLPANCLGLEDRIFEISPFRFGNHEMVKDIVSNLLADRGGIDVYNALLYMVDKEVRLGAEVVDKVYRSILWKELDLPIIYDRSSRRFYG
jgi:hypothetical protein